MYIGRGLGESCWLLRCPAHQARRRFEWTAFRDRRSEVKEIKLSIATKRRVAPAMLVQADPRRKEPFLKIVDCFKHLDEYFICAAVGDN
jgi:hypothetical protein